MSDIYHAPKVENKAPKPPGVLPRNLHAWVVGGLSVLMVAVIAFSGRNPPRTNKPAPAPAPAIADPNEARIQEYRARIDEQARRLAAEQAQIAQAKQALGLPASPAPAGARAIHPGESGRDLRAAYPPSYRERSAIELEKERREWDSLFAPSVVLSYRTAPAREQGPARGASAPQQAQPATAEEKEEPDADRDLARAGGKTYRVFEGTVIETVLTNRLDGSFSGPVNCMVTTNVYSHDRRRLVIPQGSRILGEAKRVETFGQKRLAVAFHRLIMPDGFSVTLDQFQGLNQVGETGLRDRVNHHYLQVFGVSLAIGAIAGLAQANTRYGFDASAEDAYRQGVAASLSQSSLRILDRYLNVLPTFTIREGHRVKVYLSNDLLLPAYVGHQMPGDL